MLPPAGLAPATYARHTQPSPRSVYADYTDYTPGRDVKEALARLGPLPPTTVGAHTSPLRAPAATPAAAASALPTPPGSIARVSYERGAGSGKGVVVTQHVATPALPIPAPLAIPTAAAAATPGPSPVRGRVEVPAPLPVGVGAIATRSAALDARERDVAAREAVVGNRETALQNAIAQLRDQQVALRRAELRVQAQAAEVAAREDAVARKEAAAAADAAATAPPAEAPRVMTVDKATQARGDQQAVREPTRNAPGTGKKKQQPWTAFTRELLSGLAIDSLRTKGGDDEALVQREIKDVILKPAMGGEGVPTNYVTEVSESLPSLGCVGADQFALDALKRDAIRGAYLNNPLPPPLAVGMADLTANLAAAQTLAGGAPGPVAGGGVLDPPSPRDRSVMSLDTLPAQASPRGAGPAGPAAPTCSPAATASPSPAVVSALAGLLPSAESTLRLPVAAATPRGAGQDAAADVVYSPTPYPRGVNPAAAAGPP